MGRRAIPQSIITLRFSFDAAPGRRLVRGLPRGLRLPSCCGRYSRIVIGPRRGRATRAWVILLFLYSIRHGIAGAPGGAAVGIGRLVYLLGSKITSAKR